MATLLSLPPLRQPPGLDVLRCSVRTFLDEELAAARWAPGVDTWLTGYDADFSRRLGQQGWIGMTWPRQYGGSERTAVERFTVVEELLAAGAPVAAHWVADRQSGNALLKYGTEDQRVRLLPPIARGEQFWSIGMSEPDSGSDLSSVRCRAVQVDGGWRLSGTKIWTSGAQHNHFMITLVRTHGQYGDRHRGLSQLIVDLSSPEVEIRPIEILTGAPHFNEVVFHDVFVPDSMVLGEAGNGWRQVTSELVFERSGPERYLSTIQLLEEYVASLGADAAPDRLAAVGGLVAQLWAVRQLALRVASAFDAGQTPDAHAAVAKDLGTRLEKDVIEVVRLDSTEEQLGCGNLATLLSTATHHAPGFTLRGGTNEILRSVVTKGLGL